MWFDDEEPEGFPHVVDDAVFAFVVLAAVTGFAFAVRLIFF